MEVSGDMADMLFDDDDMAVMDEDKDDSADSGLQPGAFQPPTAGIRKKPRSHSDGGGTPSKLSPSPHIVEANRRISKDDSNLRESSVASSVSTPVTPHRAEFPRRGLSLQMPQQPAALIHHQVPQHNHQNYPHQQFPSQQHPDLFTSPASTAGSQPRSPYPAASKTGVPLSPKLDHSQIYASPTNILPRRSRGLDFSRAATSLHHSMLAEQSSPDSSPTIGGPRGAMNIPNRRSGDFGGIGGPEMTSSSLWSVMGTGSNQPERMHISSSLGSAHPLGSDSSSSSDFDDMMDEDMDEAYVTTPQVNKSTPNPVETTPMAVAAWLSGASPAANSLRSFQQRQRSRRQANKKKKLRAPLGLGFAASSSAAAASLSKSPPSSMTKESAHSRRESISWQANQLHISGTLSEGEDSSKNGAEGQRSVIRRVVTRRGNLLPKAKAFARIRAALAEEGAPVESEFRREAEVVRQVRESDMDLEPRIPPGFPGVDGAMTRTPALSAATTRQSSPVLGPSAPATQDTLDGVAEGDDFLAEATALGLSGGFKQQALRNSRGSRNFWDTFSESSSVGGPGSRITPPPPGTASGGSYFLPRGSSSGVSEDASMDSPSLTATAGFNIAPTMSNESQRTASTGADTTPPLPFPLLSSSQSQTVGPQPPSAAEITRRINSKRRRDDDFDPVSFKRRAVSPGMSVHNSPIMQSPLQRDVAPWGSRPGSNSGDKGSSAASETGSLAGTGTGTGTGTPSNGTAGSSGGNAAQGGTGRVNGRNGRVGFQGMVDTSDGMMRMSIE